MKPITATFTILALTAVTMVAVAVTPMRAHATPAAPEHIALTTSVSEDKAIQAFNSEERPRHHRHHDHWAWLRGEALAWAETQAGKPYIWGETGPWGYDCSGLVYAAYRQMRHMIPRDTFGMLAALGGRLRIWRGKVPPRGALAFYGSGHVELLLSFRKHLTFGAEAPGTDVGRHRWSEWWHPSLYVVVI